MAPVAHSVRLNNLKLLRIAALLIACPVSVLAAPQRIVTLSPHLTEWVYSLGAGDRLVAVSAHSDYPAEAQTLPVVANYNGADIGAIVALNPDLILAWQGGNKPQDLARLTSLGFSVYLSQPLQPQDIADELLEVARLLEVTNQAQPLADRFRQQLTELQSRYYTDSPLKVFYYMWSRPLMTVGPDAWANQLLKVCGAQTLFADSPVDYPQVSVQQVLLRQPALLVAASQSSEEALAEFWTPHRDVLSAPLITADPDKLSRFTLRLLPELSGLCENIHQTQTLDPVTD